MTQFFSKILCPVDFDDNSMAALDFACKLAKENDSVLYLLHVVSGVVPLVSQEPSRAELSNIAAKRVEGRVRYYEVLSRSGQPAEAIKRTAEEMGVDLIVMATHGRTGAAHLLVGSVAEEVVRIATQPVLTIRPAAGAA